MLFAVSNIDKPGHLELRKATRAVHLDYLISIQSSLYMAGPILDAEGLPMGSLLIIEAEDEAQARALATADPYVAAGLFASTSITGYRAVFEKFTQVAA